MTGEALGDVPFDEFLLQDPDYTAEAVVVRFPRALGADALRLAIEQIQGLGKMTVHPIEAFFPSQSGVPEVAASQDDAQPHTMTQVQLKQHAEKYSTEGNVKAGEIWGILQDFAAVIRDAQRVVEEAKTNSRPLYHLGAVRTGYSLENVQIFARLPFRFTQDQRGNTVMDVDSLYRTLKQLKDLAQANRDKIPIRLPNLAAGRVGFLIHLVNLWLEPDEPLSYEGILFRH